MCACFWVFRFLFLLQVFICGSKSCAVTYANSVTGLDPTSDLVHNYRPPNTDHRTPTALEYLENARFEETKLLGIDYATEGYMCFSVNFE